MSRLPKCCANISRISIKIVPKSLSISYIMVPQRVAPAMYSTHTDFFREARRRPAAAQVVVCRLRRLVCQRQRRSRNKDKCQQKKIDGRVRATLTPTPTRPQRTQNKLRGLSRPPPAAVRSGTVPSEKRKYDDIETMSIRCRTSPACRFQDLLFRVGSNM